MTMMTTARSEVPPIVDSYIDEIRQIATLPVSAMAWSTPVKPRSADSEYTLVTGVHGPGEVHMVLIG